MERGTAGARAVARRWLWCVRITVWSGFVLTVVGAGPRAWVVLGARVSALRGSVQRGSPRGAHVDLDRVGFVSVPTWLRGDLLTSVALDLMPAFDGRVGLLDEEGCQRLLADLRSVPWVRDASLQRVYPDRFRAAVALRVPVARLIGDRRSLAIDADGVCLPCPPRSDLPTIEGRNALEGSLGQVHPDAAVRAAAAVAAEWSADITPAVPDLPALRRVDATNLGYVAHPGRMCEIRVALERDDGGLVWLDYDHPPGSDAPRVAAQTKVAVLQGLLAAHPRLVGIARADLRFGNRWQAWVEHESARASPP